MPPRRILQPRDLGSEKNRFNSRVLRTNTSHIMSTTDQNQHVFPRKFKFFRVMLLGFNTKLALPQRLTNHFIKENLRLVTLLSPIGTKSTWNVRIGGDNKLGLHFAEGWERFAADHRLSFGDLLVFKYVGGMVFHVTIFDKSTCEKDYYKITDTGVAGDHDHVPSQEENCDDQLESHEYYCSLGKTNWTPPSSGQRSTPPVMEQETDKDETQVSSVRKADYKQMCKRGSRFMITISAKIKYTARIPVKFSRSNDLSSARQMLLRDPEGHPWPVNLLHCKHSASRQDWLLLSAGWRDFLIGNELKDGDVCVFELKNKSEMLVQIRRSCEDGSSDRSKSPLQEVVRPSNKRAATLQQKQKGSPSMVTRSSSKPADHPAQFSSTIVPSNLYKKGNMDIPKAFLSLADLSAEKEAVLVDPHSRRRWAVKICYPWKDGRCRMGGGWERFCEENNVQVGDVCVFSFKNHTKKRDACTFQVEVIKSSKT